MNFLYQKRNIKKSVRVGLLVQGLANLLLLLGNATRCYRDLDHREIWYYVWKGVREVKISYAMLKIIS